MYKSTDDTLLQAPHAAIFDLLIPTLIFTLTLSLPSSAVQVRECSVAGLRTHHLSFSCALASPSNKTASVLLSSRGSHTLTTDEMGLPIWRSPTPADADEDVPTSAQAQAVQSERTASPSTVVSSLPEPASPLGMVCSLFAPSLPLLIFTQTK